jgi:hypothetical protein
MHPPTLPGFLADRRLRCSSLQALDVDWQDAHEFRSHTVHLKFEGAGGTPQEQRASMLRQLAAMRSSSTKFLAPESWPASSCLTSFTFEEGLDSPDTPYLQAAIHTPSLAHLEVDMAGDSSDWLLGGLSILQRLTSLTLSSSCSSCTLDEAVIEGIGQLSSLQRLRIGLHLLDGGHQDYGGDSSRGFAVPATWSALSSLTHVYFVPSSDHRAWDGREPRLLTAQLSRLAAVEHLQLRHDYSCSTSGFAVGGFAVGEVPSLFALTRLTSLVGPPDFYASDGSVAGGEAASSGGLEVPRQWTERLQRLDWSECRSGGSLLMLPQLTSLTYLQLTGACISPQLCR